MHFFPFGFDDDDFGGGFSGGFGKPKPKKTLIPQNTTKF